MTKIFSLRPVLFLVLLCSCNAVFAQITDTDQKIIPGRVNSPAQDPANRGRVDRCTEGNAEKIEVEKRARGKHLHSLFLFVLKSAIYHEQQHR